MKRRVTSRRSLLLRGVVMLSCLAVCYQRAHGRGNPKDGSASASSTAGVFLVTMVSGDVLVRTPNSDGWSSVHRDDYLHAGQVVQVTKGGAIRLRQARIGQFGGIDADNADLLVQAPLLFRLGSSLLRKVKLERHFIDRLPNWGLTVDANAKGAPNTLRFDEAWKKAAALFTDTKRLDANTVFREDQTSQDGVSLGLSSQHLEILTPAPEAEMMSDSFPTEMEVSWLAEAPEVHAYQIYVWRAGEQPTGPVGTTSGDRYAVTFGAPGSYYVRVTSTDGRWQSQPRLINVRNARDDLVANQASSPSNHREHHAELQLPPPEFRLLTHESQASLSFYWESRDAYPLLQAELVVLDPGNVELRRLPTKPGVVTSTALPVGRYKWYVDAIWQAPDHRTVVEQTIKRDLRIEAMPEPLAHHLTATLMAPGTHGTWELSDGL